FDVVAYTANKDDPSLIIECRYRKKPVDAKEIERFFQKVEELKKEIPVLIPIIYSVSGFTQPALEAMKRLNIAWSTPDLWKLC
ncbi:MAG: restriction endonuclease, partial [bacterium]|nr:restriction endonuclease [bacterium]